MSLYKYYIIDVIIFAIIIIILYDILSVLGEIYIFHLLKNYCVVIKRTCSRIKISRSKSGLAVWPLKIILTSLSFNFPIYKLEM